MTESIAATASAATDVVACTGVTEFVITDALKQGEYIRLMGEDPAGTYLDELHRFTFRTPASVLIEAYRGVQVNKTATSVAIGVDYNAS